MQEILQILSLTIMGLPNRSKMIDAVEDGLKDLLKTRESRFQQVSSVQNFVICGGFRSPAVIACALFASGFLPEDADDDSTVPRLAH